MTNLTTTLSGYFKEVYADKVEFLVPEGNMFYKDIPFAKRKQQNGNAFHQPVALSHEHGFTYESADASAFSINAAVAATHKDAQVTGTQMLLETRISYEVAARGNGSPKAFGAVTGHIMENMIRSFYKREEIKHLYGGSSSIYTTLGRLGLRSDDSSTVQTYAVATGHWAPGIWAGLEGALVDAYDDDGTGGAPSTKLNTGGDITVTSVDFAAKSVTLTGVEADLDKLTTSTTTGAYLVFKGAFGKDGNGAVVISTNTGTLHNIAGGTYSLWQGNTYSASSAALTFSKTLKAYDDPVGRGLQEDVCQYTNPKTWTNLMSDLAALRQYDNSYSPSKNKNGSKGIEFCGQFGSLELKPHIFMKEGISLGCAKKRWKRLGATPMTFKVPGMEEEKFLYQLPSNAGYANRAYSNEALFSDHPAYNVLITDIVNS